MHPIPYAPLQEALRGLGASGSAPSVTAAAGPDGLAPVGSGENLQQFNVSSVWECGEAGRGRRMAFLEMACVGAPQDISRKCGAEEGGEGVCVCLGGGDGRKERSSKGDFLIPNRFCAAMHCVSSFPTVPILASVSVAISALDAGPLCPLGTITTEVGSLSSNSLYAKYAFPGSIGMVVPFLIVPKRLQASLSVTRLEGASGRHRCFLLSGLVFGLALCILYRLNYHLQVDEKFVTG
eukprot:360988-Chlamydomonas_euryale.AAC.4